MSAPVLRHVTNLRDLGGVPTRDGGRTRHERLWRSASLADASASDVARLRSLGIRDVVDLRADWEVAAIGPVPSAFHTHRIDLVPDAERDRAYDHLRRGGLAGYYVFVLERAPELLVRLVATVAEAPAGVLVQCGAGKDRTGVAVAVLLDLLGVADERIADDYTRTTDALPAIRAAVARTPGYTRSLSTLPREALTAPPEAITTALARLRQRHGSLRSHLARAGLTDDLVERLRARLRTPAPARPAQP